MFIESLEDRRLLAWDMTLNATATVNVSSNTVGSVTTFAATGTGANLDWNDVQTALAAGNSVVIDSGSTGTESGNITDQTGANLTGLPGSLSLTIESGTGTNLVGNISIEGINLDSASSSIVVDANGSVSTGLLSGGTFAIPAPLASANIAAGGSIGAQTSPLPGPISAANVNLSAVTGIGASGNDLPISATNLTSNTSSGNGNQFLIATGAVNLNTTNALNAGNGAITLDGGTFQIQAAAGGNAIADTSSLTVNSPATLDLAGNSESVDGLSGNGTVTSSVAGPVTLTVGANGGGGSFNGLIQNGAGTVQLTKTGAGTEVFSSNNTYGGVTLVNGGVLNIRSGGALGSTSAGTTVAAGAALQIQGGISVGEPLTLNGNGVSNDGALRNMATNNFWSGPITLASDSTIGGTSGVGNELVLSNSIGQTGGARSLNVVGPLSLVMQGGANAYTGTTTVITASLRLRGTQIQGPMVIGDGSHGGSVVLDASNQINDAASVTVNSDGAFTLGALGSVNETIDRLIGSGTVSGAGTPGSDSLTIGANGGSATFSGLIQNGAASTTLSITKIGGGAEILTGANTYSGGTNVNAGTLLVNNIAGSGTGSGTVNVNNNAALGGTGVISGPVNINNTAHLAPGAGAGILGTGSVAFGGGTNFDVDINGPSVGAQYDQLVVSGSAALGGANLNLTGAYTPVVGDSFTILQTSAGVTPTFSGLPQGAVLFFNLQPLVIDYTANGNKNVVLSYDSTPTIQGGAGADDFTVSLDGSGNVVVKDGVTTVMVTPQASLTGLVIDGNGGANTLLVDESNGILNIPITFNGGGTGSLTVAGYSGVHVTDTYTSTGPGHSGTVQIGAGGLISYTGLAPLTLSGTASDLVIDLSQTGVANSVVVADDGSAADPDATNNVNTSAIYSTTNAFDYTQFTNPTNSLTVDLGNSGDTIAVQNMDAAFAPAGTAVAAPFMINGGNGGDTYNVQSTADVGGGGYGSLNIAAGSGNDTFNVSSNAPTNSGNLSAIASTLNIDGGAGSNTLNVSESGSGSPDTVLVTSSQIASAITPFTINYSATGGTFGGGLNLATGSADDTINVQSTLAGGTTTINTGNGNDTINVSGPLSGAVSILGGSQTTADVLNYNAGGQNVTLSANSITAGAGQTLTFAGIEDVNITNVAGVTVNGDGNANNLVLTRTGATTDAYQLDGGPVVSLDGASSFRFAGGLGADHMQINETAFGLPAFSGSAAFHINGAFGSSGLLPANYGINFSGGGNAGDSLGISFLTSQNVSYFDDNYGAAHSGVVNVENQFSLSFNGLAPVNFTGAGGTLTVNTLADPTNTNLTVADDGTPGDGVSQITGNGGFETTTFSGFNNLVAQGLNAGGELITLAGLDSATTLSNVTLQGGAGFDIINVQSLPATVAAALLGGGGGNNFTLDNASHNLQQIAGPVVVSPAGDVGAVGNVLFVYDYGDATSRTVQVTSSTIEGITGFAGGPDITYGAGSQMTSVSILGGGGGNTFNVQSTRAGTSYFVNSGAGDDTVNVSSTAPAVNGNGTLTGDLNGIQGELDLVSGAGNDTLNVSDYGGVGRNYTVASPGAGVTLISPSGAANIVYNFAGGPTLEHFNLVGASVGGNTYNILDTTATLSNVVSDGDASASGNSTFNIQADQLQAGASNSFNGFAGDDTFNLNFAAGASVPSAAGTTLSIDGGGLATGNDRVNVNANQAGDGARTVGLNYQSNATSNVQIAGLGTASNAIGVIGARQINYYGDAANNDTVSVSGAASGNNTLSVTPLSANSADVFLGGNPLLTIPPGSTGSNNPGVAGGGAGPDLFVGGVALAGFSVNGGSTGAGNGNRLVVNGKTENLNGAGGTSAWGGNAFGSPADTVAAGNGYDQIDVSDSKVSIVNNAVGALLAVNYAPNSFANPSPTQAAVTVNGGDETTPAAGVADDFTVHLSPTIHFQINGGAPATGSAPHGDRLNVLTPNDAEIWSDAATPPNVSITSSGSLPVSYNSIEELSLTPGNGIVNIYGDNNVSGGAQNDGYRVVGTGPNAFTLQISGDKNNPASYSDPIQISGVTTLNAYGEAQGVENTGSDINALYVTPWANNTPQGWGVQTFWDQGDKNNDGDLLVYNGVSGVSENINVQPSASEAGQLFSTNAATGTPIAVINYTLNTNVIVNGNDGSAGDTDTLTLNGTDPANPGASGNDLFSANFAAAGTPADPMVVVTDKVGGAALYTLQSLSNINTVNVNMQGGSDFFNLVSGRNDGSLTVNVNGGAPSGAGSILNTDGIQVDGTAGADSFTVSPGASNDAGRIAVQLAGATAPTVLNFTGTENLSVNGGAAGADNVTLNGTGSDDTFALANGTAQVDSNAPVSLGNFGPGSTLSLNGLGGANSFSIDQATGSQFASVNINGGSSGNGSVSLTGTNANDAINFTPFSANSGQIAVTDVGTTNYNLTGITSASIDALGQTTGDSLNVASAGIFVNTPGAQPGSGTVQVTLPGNIASLPLAYANVEHVTFSGTVLVINGTSGNDHVAVAADGSVMVNNNPVSTAGFLALVLNLQGGSDDVSIAAGANFPAGIIVNGAGQTNVTVTGTAGDDTIGVNAAAGQVTGVVSGTITLVGVQNLTVNGGGAATGDAISITNLGVPGGLQSINVTGNGAAGDTLHVSGSGGPDNMLVTPTGATSGTLQDSGVGPLVNYSGLSAAGALQVTANAVTVDGSAADDNISVTNGRVTVAGDLPVNYNTSAVALNIMGLGGNDVLTVDSTTGAVTTPIYYDGGAGSNALVLTGGTATSDIYSPGAATGQGLNSLVIGGNAETVHFVNLAPVIDNIAGPLVVNGTNGDDAINYSADAANPGNGLVSVNNLETISFVNKTSLAINAGAGNDTISLNNSGTPSGLTSISVNGGDPTSDSDTLIVNGEGHNLVLEPTAQGAGTVNYFGGGLPSTPFTNIEHLSFVETMANPVGIDGTAGNDQFIYTPGVTPDSATITGTMNQGGAAFPLVPVTLTGANQSGANVFNAFGQQGGTDSFVYNGVPGNDAISVAAGGPFGGITLSDTVAGQLYSNLNLAHMGGLTIDGGDGNDTVSIAAGVATMPIAVNGNSAQSDVLNFTGNGAGAVTVDLTADTVTEAGFSPVSFNGIGSLNVNAAGQPVIVNDTSGPNTLEVTPTGASSALLQVQGANPVVNLTNAASLALGFTPTNNNQLVVNATPNADTINVSGASVAIVGLLAVNETGVASLTVNGLQGSDTFNVAAAAIPIHINGGDPIGVLPGDTLNILAGGSPVQFFAGPHVDEGGFVVGTNAAISFQQIETIGAIINPGPVLIVGTNGDDDIQVIARDSSYNPANPGVPNPLLDGVQDYTVSVNQGPNILFVDAPNLYIDALSGDDQVDVRTPAPNNAVWNTQVTVAGGAPAGQPGLNGDNFTLETPGSGSQVTYQPTAIDGGVFTIANLLSTVTLTSTPFTIPAINYISSAGGFESATYDGQGANDSLTILGTTGDDTVTSTPDAANDAGTIAVNSLLALSYKNLGATGSIVVDGNSGTDALVANGTAGNDSFAIDAATGTVHVNSQTPIQQTGIANLVLNGLGGDNTYNIAAAQPYSSITVNGSGNSDPDVLNLAGDGSSPVTVNLGGPTQTVSGGGLGTVDITGVGIVNLSNATGAINVLGTTGPDSLSVTPTGANTATIQDGALAPVLNTTNTGALNIVEGTAGDGDTVTVHGTSNNDVINVVEGATTTVQVGGLKTVSINTADVEALVVDGGLGADTFNVSGTGGPALTIAGGQTPAADTLNLATVNATVTYGTDPSSGAIDTGAGVVSFADIKTINLTGNTLGSLAVNGTNGNDAINQLNSQVAVNNGAVVNFVGYASLALNGLAGNDQFNVNPTTLPAGMTFNVNGGTSTSGDSLVVNGSAAQDLIGFAPSGANAGSVAIGLSPVVAFTAIANVSVNGQGGNDLLTVTTPAGADAITYTAGATVDAASVQVGSLVPMSFTNLGSTGRVALADTSGNPVDNLLYNGTAGNDTFGVNATGIVFLNSQLQVSIPGIASLTLDGQGGVNAFSVAGNVAIPVNVNGGSASAGNALTVLGDGSAPLTVDLGNHTIQEAGFGLISFNGLSQVNVDAASQDINVVGGAGDDNISYTPNGTDAGALQLAGLNTVFNLTAVGNLSVDPLGGMNTVTVNGNANANTIDVVRGANTSVQVDSLQSISIVAADTQTIGVNSGLGDDTVNVSGSGGSALAINGGSAAASDTLNVTANGFTQVSFGANSTSGTVATTDPQIAFAGIAVLGLTGDTNSSLSVFATNGNDAINLNENVVTVNAGTNVDFINYPTLNLFGQSGDDVFNVWPTTLAGVSAINIDGGDPTASDKLIVNGTSGADNINFAPTSADAGSVTISGSPTVNFTTTESVAINGQGNNDTLTYTSPAGAPNVITFDPGATANSGSIHARISGAGGPGDALVPLDYSNIARNGALVFAHSGGGATDRLNYNGTAGNDTFSVSPAGITLLQSDSLGTGEGLSVQTPGITFLTLNGLAGDDTFNLQGPLSYSTIGIVGSGEADPPVANLTGDGSAMRITLNAASAVVTGGGLGTVTITGVGIINASNGGGNVTLADPVDSTTLDVTPTSATQSTSTVDGSGLIVNTTNSGTFNVSFTGTDDNLVVNGTAAADTINVTGALVGIVGEQTVNFTGAAALTVNGSTGSDTFNVTPDAVVPIHVNGGDPIGVLPGDTLNIVAGGSPVSFFSGPHSDEGGFQVGSDAAVSFQQIESIGPIVGPGPVLIVGTNGDDDIQVIARDSSYSSLADGVQDYTVSVNQGPNILFIDSPQLYIDALSGDDEVDVRAPAPNHADWNTQVTIAGGAPAGQPSLNGDNFTLETPGVGNQVTYQPNAIDGGVFTFGSSTITLTSAPFTIPAINYTSSAGGFESATYDGQGGNAALTIVGTTGNDTITHTAGAANDAGELAVNSLLALSYKNLGATGSILVDGNGGVDTLVVDGTANNDKFTVDGTTGTVHLNNRVAIAQTDITNLVLNGYNPNNTFNLNASLPYESTAVNSIDPATLNLNGTAGAETIGVDLTNSQITGFGGVVSFVGVATVNMNGNGGADSLTVTGTTNDDVITYKPTSSGGGTFSLAGMPVNFNFNIGAGNVFTVNGGGGNGGDEVDVLGNNAGSVITVDSPNRTVSVENALNVVLMPVVLGSDVQVASVAGGIGNNTILVIPARNVPPTNDTVGPGFKMPNNLLVHVNGGAVPSNAALVVADTNGATLDSSLFAVVNRTSNTSGVVRLFQSTGGPEPIQYPDISYTNVGIVQASTAVNATTHQQQTLTMGPDLSDPNGSLNNAAYLGSGASINATNLTIFPNAFEHRFLQAEQDWFRVVAQYTGTMDFQVYFKQYAGFLPGGGELQIQVYDAAGNQITHFGVNDTDSDQRRRIPVVAGETYYLQVYGITQDPNFTPADGFDPTNATVNAYSLSITNTPAPSPDRLGLNNIVAQGSINNAIAPTTTTFTASNAAVPPPPTQPLPPLSSIDGFYVGKYLEFTSGALIGQRQLVTAYVGATHTFTFASPFSAAPAVGDKFQIESNDTGRTQFDNVTRDNTPTIYIRLDAANTPTDGLLDLQGGGSTSQTPPNNTPILIPFWAGNSATPPNSPDNNGSFRVAVYDDTNPQSPLFLGYANAVPGQQGVFQLQVTTPLSDGSHILAAKVEIDSPSAPSNKDLSSAATFQMVVDTQAPPVYFGSPTVANSGLLGSSDTGVNGQPATIVDRITADSTPTLYGAAEANAVVRLYSDTNNNGIVDNGDVFLGLTTASPVDGTNQFPSGQWQITTNVDLNNPTRGFPLDGVRHLLVTAEDVAGNVSAPQALTIFLDTQGPVVKNVSVTGSPGFDLFAVKANTVNPTPLVNSLDITFNDQPIRVGPNFVYPAVNPILATTPGNYILIGDATGRVVITSVTFSDSTASGTPGMSVATLHFAAPLPDDRYTLTISDNITDNAGNNLDGEFGPTFSSGNGKIGGQFLGRFTVDSRPELGTYSSGSVAIDLNGNFVFDPQNLDQTNRDTTFAMGFSTDRLFAGKLADSHGVVNGFDKLGAYGFLNGQWRWLLDLDGDGVIDPAKGDLSVVEPLALDAMPVAGNWTNSPTHADQIGLFDGKTWWLDMNGDHVIDATDIALGGELTGNMKGLPIVGDFDGDGKTDLGTFANGMFYFDLSSKDPGGKLTGNYNTTLNVQTDLPNNAGFAGVLARPVAADMNQDGITDIGLFVPGRTQNASASTAEWYWLISNDPNGTNRIPGTVNTLNHPFDPTPLGHDLYAQFGSQFALPIVGNFDPPANGGSGGTQSGGGNWIQNLYLDVLGRAASTDEVAYWTDQVNHGVTASQIATLFLTSTEHRSQLINTLYQQYLGRQADQAGINYWISIWNATGGPEAVQAGIIGSAEYYATAGGTDAAWVTALYQNILGRTVDAQGLAYWTDYIKTHSKQSVVMGFVTSDEYRLGLINGWFQVYLGRTLDASGAQFWLNQMKLGETQEQIQAGILGSTEFRNR